LIRFGRLAKQRRVTKVPEEGIWLHAFFVGQTMTTYARSFEKLNLEVDGEISLRGEAVYPDFVQYINF
jgi:hypothetical protein